MSDTPKTDSAAFSPRTGNQWEELVDADFARQLERELAEARRDAARYRWMKMTANPGQPYDIFAKMREAKHLLEVYNLFCTTHVEWDAAIDAAMAADPPAAEKG